MLDDSAGFARAALALFEATGQPSLSGEHAEAEARGALARFGAADGGLYLTADRRGRGRPGRACAGVSTTMRRRAGSA